MPPSGSQGAGRPWNTRTPAHSPPTAKIEDQRRADDDERDAPPQQPARRAVEDPQDDEDASEQHEEGTAGGQKCRAVQQHVERLSGWRVQPYPGGL
jgi:hypothetical protein